MRTFVKDTWGLARPYWFSEERWAGRGLLLVIIGLSLGQVWLNVVFNDWNGLFYNALQDKNLDEFYHQMERFCMLAAIFIVIAVYQVYLNQMLQIRWRRWLTDRYLEDWLAEQAYYRLQIGGGPTDNPDQRIADDLDQFVESTLRLTLGLLSAVVTLVSFLGILWGLSGDLVVPLWGGLSVTIPGYMVWIALIYAAIGSGLTQLIGRPLARLNFQQQRFEADFRFSLVRLRENAEGVALYRGEAVELATFRERFSHVVANWWGIMRCRKRLTWFTSGYAQAAVVFPYLVAAPRYFSGAIELGGLMQTANAFGQVQESLSWFVDAYVSVAEWRATVDRLTHFHTAVHAARAAARLDPTIRRGQDGATLVLDGLTLTRPDGAPLVAADHRFAPGEAVLITGESGSGKSTLFRALAGLWPHGSGRIGLPAGARLLFLPQKPYLPIGTLARAVAYPAADGDYDPAALAEVLTAVGLPALAGRLDEVDHWGQRLSPGEQQRLAIARALLARPDWLFLDEATSACDGPAEARLHALLRQRLPHTTLISIGHRPSLAGHHERRLEVSDGRLSECREPG